MPRIQGHNGHRYRRIRAAILAASDTCGICHHPGAGEADLITPVSLGGSWLDPTNFRPAHGTTSRCPICIGVNGRPRACNQARGNGTRRPRRHTAHLSIDAHLI